MGTVLNSGNVMVLKVSAITEPMVCFGVHMSDWAKSALDEGRAACPLWCLTQAWWLPGSRGV